MSHEVKPYVCYPNILLSQLTSGDMTGKKQNKRIRKLESKLDALLDYLKLEAYTEELEGFHSKEPYFDSIVTKKKKDDF